MENPRFFYGNDYDLIEGFKDDFFNQPAYVSFRPEAHEGTPIKTTDPDLLFDSLQGYETISEPFEFKIRLYHIKAEVDLKKLLNKPFGVYSEDSGKTKRYFSGTVTNIVTLPIFEMDEGGAKSIGFCGLILRPGFWISKLSKNSRIFYKKTTIEIIESVLQEDKVTFSNKVQSAGKTVVEYCVQHSESNFDFVSRLMESVGIFYFFTYAESGETMVLVEKNKDGTPISDKCSLKVVKRGTINSVFSFNLQEKIVTKKFSAIDVDYMKPNTVLKATESGEGEVGEINEYPGGYIDSDGASKVATVRIGEISGPKKLGYGEGSILAFSAGGVFTLEDSPRKTDNQKYLLYSVNHSLRVSVDKDSQEFQVLYSNTFTALPEATPFYPTRKTPQPCILGLQTATVVGADDKEIASDTDGRILVQFHWDKEGTKNGKNSCPVRCSQILAGKSFGVAFVPRVGMEVLVGFMHGNPDCPVIMGCLYNGVNKMPAEVTANPQILMLKTQTTPQDGEKANILSFDDTKDKEVISLVASKNLDISSKAKENTFSVKQEGEKTQNTFTVTDGLVSTTITKGEKKTTLNEGNLTVTLKKGSFTVEMDNGDNLLTVKKGNYIINISDGEITVNTKKALNIKSEGTVTVESTKDMTFKSQGAISIEAGKNLELKAPAGNINSTAKAIKNAANTDYSIEGLNVKIAAKLDLKGEGLNLGLEAKLEAKFGGLMANVEGKLVAGIKGAAGTAVG